MWDIIVSRALVMFAQATGSPNVTRAAVEGQGTFRHTIWHTILLIIYFIVCLGLVATILMQTTKSEGLSGVIGGSTQSVFRGKKGFDERLQEITNYLAISFLVLSFIVSLFAFKVK